MHVVAGNRHLGSTEYQPVQWETRNSDAWSTVDTGTYNPLFKVLCIFPSWYLFSIGPRVLFSSEVKHTTRLMLPSQGARLMEGESNARSVICKTGQSPFLVLHFRRLTFVTTYHRTNAPHRDFLKNILLAWKNLSSFAITWRVSWYSFSSTYLYA